MCFLYNTDSRNYSGDVAGGMGSICHIHSSDCNLHMVPSKILISSSIYSRNEYLISGKHDNGNNHSDFESSLNTHHVTLTKNLNRRIALK